MHIIKVLVPNIIALVVPMCLRLLPHTHIHNQVMGLMDTVVIIHILMGAMGTVLIILATGMVVIMDIVVITHILTEAMVVIIILLIVVILVRTMIILTTLMVVDTVVMGMDHLAIRRVTITNPKLGNSERKIGNRVSFLLGFVIPSPEHSPEGAPLGRRVEESLCYTLLDCLIIALRSLDKARDDSSKALFPIFQFPIFQF